MEIVECWEDHKANIYAIVRHSEKDQQEYRIKSFEALWLDDGELNSFAGTVGFRIADFNTVKEAQEFLLKGIALEDENPDIWWKMLVV